MPDTDDLLICTACGTQYSEPHLTACRICDDPREFVPPAGQTFTTLAAMKSAPYSNRWERFKDDSRIWTIWTEPKFAIGQRCFLLQTNHGNILWDLIAFLDQRTVDFIESVGGIAAVVISHPHYYTTYAEWAKKFRCPVYFSKEEMGWVNEMGMEGVERRFVDEEREEIVIGGVKSGVCAIKCGGHFEGSLVLVWGDRLFIADTLVTTPSGLYYIDRPAGTTSYTFMWSIPNMIPLSPAEIQKIWTALKPIHFTSTHGAFLGMDISGPDVKGRVLESMQIQTRREGYEDHALLRETWQG